MPDSRLASILCLDDFETAARRHLPRPIFGYVAGAVESNRSYRDNREAFDKRRPKANVSEVMHVIGEIDGRNCVIMDDMIDTAGTLVKAAEVLKERGAKKVYAYCTHPIFSGPALERIAQGSALDEVVVTNTIPLSSAAAQCQKIRQLSVAPLIAETIQRIAKGESVMSLFSDQENLF